MNIIESEIHKNFDKNDIHMYLNVGLRNESTKYINKIVNSYVPQVPITHTQEELDTLNKDGFIKFENYLNKNEIDNILFYLKDKQGYNAHVAKYSDKKLRNWDDSFEYSTFSYEPNVLLQNNTILDKLIDPHIVSLAQSYLGSFPTMYSINCWWHKIKGGIYGTQNNHRDHDDFKFLAFFIYLTDIDESNGPHVYYSGTKDGEENGKENVITGKAGTAILADTFAIHRGQPLQQGNRLLVWWRYGLYLNNMHFHDGNNNFKISKEILFDKIPPTPHNEYMFRGFL